jgi:hypothetical protein
MTTKNSIGTLREQHLHASLKQWLAEPGDSFEQKVDGYHIDIVRDDLLIEIQTGNFLKLKTKLNNLLKNHQVLLVHPIPQTKWILRKSKRGKKLSRRKSPKRGRVEHVFDELLYIPEIASHPNFTLRVLLTEQDEIWKDDGRGSWRRKHWSIIDKVLLDVKGSSEFGNIQDYLSLIPPNMSYQFTHRQLAEAINAPIWTITRMSYCLRKMGVLKVAGKQGRSLLLSPIQPADKIRLT